MKKKTINKLNQAKVGDKIETNKYVYEVVTMKNRCHHCCFKGEDCYKIICSEGHIFKRTSKD